MNGSNDLASLRIPIMLPAITRRPQITAIIISMFFLEIFILDVKDAFEFFFLLVGF